jgi:ethanolamine transporter EutH
VSRYLILVLLNTPLIVAALLGILVDFKMNKISRKKMIFQTSIWLLIFTGLASAKYIYQFLFSNKLTQTEPLSLFDVIQITGIITVLFIANRSRIKTDRLERRVQDLHQELSIKLSKND